MMNLALGYFAIVVQALGLYCTMGFLVLPLALRRTVRLRATPAAVVFHGPDTVGVLVAGALVIVVAPLVLVACATCLGELAAWAAAVVLVLLAMSPRVKVVVRGPAGAERRVRLTRSIAGMPWRVVWSHDARLDVDGWGDWADPLCLVVHTEAGAVEVAYQPDADTCALVPHFDDALAKLV